MMNLFYLLKIPFVVLSMLLFGQLSFFFNNEPPKVLVFYKTSGFVHESIPDGIAAVKKLGLANGFTVDVTNDATLITIGTLIMSLCFFLLLLNFWSGILIIMMFFMTEFKHIYTFKTH